MLSRAWGIGVKRAFYPIKKKNMHPLNRIMVGIIAILAGLYTWWYLSLVV